MTFKQVILCPVDYSVTSTGDIFELIKHDLLCELVEKFSAELAFKKYFPFVLLAQTYLKDQFTFFNFVKPFVKVLYPGLSEASEAVEH